MKLIGKYKVGKLRFRWHFDFQASTSKQDILMDRECGCGRCDKEKEKASSPSENRIGIWANRLQIRIVSFYREKLKPDIKRTVLDTFNIIVDNIKRTKTKRTKRRCKNVLDK